MKFNKKFLITALSFSLHGGIICMNEELKEQALQVPVSIQNQADALNLKRIEIWLTKQKQALSDKAWPGFVHQFVSEIEKRIPLLQSPLDEKNLAKIKDVIKDQALALESGKKCELLLRVMITESKL